MRRFQFKLHPLLKYRENRRDLCRQLLGRVIHDDQQLADQRRELIATRVGQLDELRAISTSGTVDVDRSASRRYYAGRLVAEIDAVDRQRSLVAQQIAFCRDALAKADQEVKALEKLRDKQQQAFQHEQERRNAIELEQTWLAINAMEGPR